MYRQLIKRIFDFTIAMTCLLLFSPLFLVLFLLIRFFLGSPVFFSQLRPGRYEKPFRLYKFRTMLDKRDVEGRLLNDEDRLIPFGRALRRLSLDELPGLINVLKGDMSLVGPRPLLMEYLPYYSSQQRYRHHVRPGITGWAQINGRNTLSWEKKFEYDIWYVRNYSFKLDCKILFLTLIKVIKREGINAAGTATMTRFDDEFSIHGKIK